LIVAYEEQIRALAERYDVVSVLAEDGSLAFEVDDTPVSFRKTNGFVTFRGLACKQDEKGLFQSKHLKYYLNA